MPNMPSFSQKINSSTRLSITATTSQFDDKTPLYAINWFDVKYSWLYKLYNLLVAKKLKAVGGRLHFKGKHLNKLAGDDNLKRSMLLIVYYPGVLSFFQLIKNKFFQLASIFRIVSVSHFNLGFMKRFDQKVLKSDLSKKDNYLVIVFKASDVSDDLFPELEELSKNHQFNIAFVGTLAARLQAERKNKRTSKIPFLMEGLILLNKEGDYNGLISDVQFSKLRSNFSSDYIATFKRLG